MVNVTEATMGVITEEMQNPRAGGPLFGDKEVIVGPDTTPAAVVQGPTTDQAEAGDIPDQVEFYEQLRRMPTAERLQRAKDFLHAKLADENLPPQQRQGIEMLMQQSDEFLAQFIDSQIESRFAQVSRQTALTVVSPDDVNQTAHELVQAGVMTADQAEVACENTVKLLEDGKGPKSKEEIKKSLMLTILGKSGDLLNSLITSMFAAMASK